jgi:hypothetical protein
MSKLIGTNPNQVPSNADLGTAAYMDAKDFLTSRGSSLSAIDAVIPKTAVDVFIYDTSKDSDGGAWRKRTQHTTWYNEKLNTTTRGSRREFPAVAVIVAESDKITIFDGDDPLMPMWMVTNNTSEAAPYDDFWRGSRPPSGVAAINGLVGWSVDTPSDQGGVKFLSFIDDRMYSRDSNATTYSKSYEYPNQGISQRNNTDKKGVIVSPSIIATDCFDIAMTVLPNAPIDSATGLPVPTIAVATNGGVSVIKDNGTVVDITQNQDDTNKISFAGTKVVAQKGSVVNVDMAFLGIFDIPSSDQSTSLPTFPIGDTYANPSYGTPAIYADSASYNNGNDMVSSDTDVYIGRESTAAYSGLTILNIENDKEKNMVANITSSYNTGWMNGDIKLATLADTNTNDISDSNLIFGGDGSSASGWVGSQSGQTMTSVSGQLFMQTTVNGGNVMYPIPTVAGNTYVFEFDADSQGADYGIKIGTFQGGGDIYIESDVQIGFHSYTFVAQGSTTWVGFKETNSLQTTDVYFNSVSVFELEQDRSVNNNNLEVYGTIKRTPVAAGADLVAYSGFSDSNYLMQPYNADLNAGSGSQCIMFWFKATLDGTLRYAFCLGEQDADEHLRIGMKTNHVYFDYGGGSQYTTVDAAPFSDDVWTFVVAHVTAGGDGQVYVNGVPQTMNPRTSASSPFAWDSSTYHVKIGRHINASNYSFNGSLALMRYSHTVPSDEQIKKMYEDEKVLFQENAKATLYGTSDAVTALAYDDSTDLLHVGTSAGRSVFQGLRRVDNTTDAVGTAISAVNGMVVEE